MTGGSARRRRTQRSIEFGFSLRESQLEGDTGHQRNQNAGDNDADGCSLIALVKPSF